MSGPAAPPAQQGQQVASFSNFDHKTPEMESRDFRDPYTHADANAFLSFIILSFILPDARCPMAALDYLTASASGEAVLDSAS